LAGPNDVTKKETTPTPEPSWDDVAEADLQILATRLPDESGSQQILTAKQIARIGTLETAQVLMPYAQHPGPLQAIAMAGLGWANHRPFRDILLAGLRSEDTEVRKAATWSIAATGASSFARPLSIASKHDRPEVRSSAIQAIALLGYTWMLPEVSKASLSEDPLERTAGLRALKRLGTPGSLLLLEERLATLPEEDRAVLLDYGSQEKSKPPSLPSLSDHPTDILTGILDDPTQPLLKRAVAAVELGKRGATASIVKYEHDGPRLLQLAAVAGLARGKAVLAPGRMAAVERWLWMVPNAHGGLSHPGDIELISWRQQGSQSQPDKTSDMVMEKQ